MLLASPRIQALRSASSLFIHFLLSGGSDRDDCEGLAYS